MKKEYNADPFLTSLPVPTSTKSSSLRGRQTALVIRFSNQVLNITICYTLLCMHDRILLCIDDGAESGTLTGGSEAALNYVQYSNRFIVES